MKKRNLVLSGVGVFQSRIRKLEKDLERRDIQDNPVAYDKIQEQIWSLREQLSRRG